MRYSEYVEKKKRGSEGFPLQYYYLDPQQPPYVMETHWHSELEIIRVLSGRFDVYLDNELFTLNAGDFVFVNPGTLHRGIPTQCVYECIVFDLNMLRRRSGDAAERLLAPIAKGDFHIREEVQAGPLALVEAVGRLFTTVSTPDPYLELHTFSALFEIFALLYSSGCVIPSGKAKRSSQVERISTLLDWIDEHYAEQLSLDRLAEVSGLSKKYICRIFKKYTDRTPIGYINEIRIENACYELTNAEASITDIAYNNGFEDVSYFSKLFKSHKGVSPSEYKKRSLPSRTDGYYNDEIQKEQGL